jgi:hypothetical protein
MPILVTIEQLRIDWTGRVEVLVYDQNRFIRSQIGNRFKEVKEPLSKEQGYRCYRTTACYHDEQSARPYQIDGLQTYLFLQEIEMHHIKRYVRSE